MQSPLVPASPSLAMAANLNAVIHQAQSLDDALTAIMSNDVAHHVVDPDDALDLDPLNATRLELALPQLIVAEPERWLLVLPVPGALGPLRGPEQLNRAALNVGQAVVGATRGVALIPFRLGQAVQWRAFAGARPLSPPTPYEAERAFNEAILSAGHTLQRLDVAVGHRPRQSAEPHLPPGYGGRERATVARALRLITACDEALRNDGRSISSFEVTQRERELRRVRETAGDALCATVTWLNGKSSPQREEDVQ
ncbi:MAG TPA: hypothetical protein VE462_11090 [Propionibacteriaceae bacterium]|nr:hypothetical protein [Propionibacteriaceae bacterium]